MIWLLQKQRTTDMFYFEEQMITEVRESLNKLPDFLRMGTFIDSTHIKL